VFLFSQNIKNIKIKIKKIKIKIKRKEDLKVRFCKNQNLTFRSFFSNL